MTIPELLDEMSNDYFGVRSNLTTPLDFLVAGATVSYGFDFVRNRFFRPVSDQFTGEALAPFAPDITQDSYAGFMQLQVPVGNFLLSAGVRHEEFRARVEDSAFIAGGDIPAYNVTLFNAGIVYFLSDHVELFGGFAQGAEITQLGRAGREAITRAQDEGRRARADEIDPQAATSNAYELGVRGHWSRTDTSLVVFYTESDLASTTTVDPNNPLSPLIPLREPRQIWGLEATLDQRFNDQWAVGGIFSYQDGWREVDGDTRRISSRDILPPQVSAYLDYAPFTWWRNKLQVTYTADREPFGAEAGFDEGNVESIVLVDVFASLDVLGGELSLGVENLLNNDYISVGDQASNFPVLGFDPTPREGTRMRLTYSRTW